VTSAFALRGTTAGDPDQVARYLFDWSQRLVGIDGGILFVLDGENLGASHSFEVPPAVVDGLSFDPNGEGPIQETFRHGLPQVIQGTEELPDGLRGRVPWSTVACVPLAVDDTPLGVFLAGWSAPYHIGSEATLVLQGAAAMAASAIYGARLLHDVKREQQRLRLVLEQLPIPALQFTEPDLVLTQLNAQARKLFPEVDGASVAGLIANADVEAFDGPALTSEGAQRSLMTTSTSRRIRIRSADGVTRTILPQIARFGGGGGVIMLVDVTTEANLEAQRQRFVRMVSHHLRTPLTPLVAYAGLLQEPNPSGAMVRQAASDIDLAVKQILNQVHRLEQISNLEPVDLGNLSEIRVVELVASAWSMVADEPDDLEIDGDELAMASCAPDHVRTAMAEVFTNARIHGRPPVKVSLSASRSAVVAAFGDSGAGIPDDWASAIFAPYVDTQTGYRAPAGGRLGLGLTLARGLVEASHGELRYEDGRFAFRLRPVTTVS
jgi:signal transduction histidine kinase